MTLSLQSVVLFAIKILVTFAIFAKFVDFAFFAILLYKSCELLLKNVILVILAIIVSVFCFCCC